MQLAHIEIGDTPVNIADGLAVGVYVAQVRGVARDIGVLYCTRSVAPTSDDDYFSARGDEFFSFTVDLDVGPTWCKRVAVSGAVAGTTAVAVALVS